MTATDSPRPPSSIVTSAAISKVLAAELECVASNSTTQEVIEDPVTPTTGIDGKLKVNAASSNSGEENEKAEEDEEEESGTNAWMAVIASAIDHPDQHVIKVGPFVFLVERTLTRRASRSFEH